ncbi:MULTISPECIES: hypothetical protein [Marinobacter]|uniref:hypothetical protein n=1 Tax=Marinobacter TaxID=2742 RepID=UPI0013A6B275|nr:MULTISPECIES: hypothetical protein [Marinobacter]
MALKDALGARVEWARRRLERLAPSLRERVGEQVQSLQTRLDDLNRRLAEEAVPEERKSSVGRLALERKAASAARRASQMVGAGRRVAGKASAGRKRSSGKTRQTGDDAESS